MNSEIAVVLEQLVKQESMLTSFVEDEINKQSETVKALEEKTNEQANKQMQEITARIDSEVTMISSRLDQHQEGTK